MADEQAQPQSQAQATEAQQQGEDGGGRQNGFAPITSQEELDRVIKARLERAERRFREENRETFEKAKAFDEQSEREKTELEKAREAEEKARRELEELKAQARRAEWVAEAAKAQGVDQELLAAMAGDTEDAVNDNARLLKSKLASIGRYPEARDRGAQAATGAGPTKQEILSMKNKGERYRAIKENIELFKG